VLTVIIRGNTDVENRDQRAMDRNSQGGGGFNLSGSSAGDFGAKAGNLEFSTRANGDADYDGSSQYSVDRGFSDRISLIVVDCLPNGNLVLHGERNRFVSGEKRKLVISGIVRPQNINNDNSVQSQYVANFSICYDGDGMETRFTEQGWFTKMWNKYRPL
jgi:flagellar L-ring protein precursor FlgH